MIIKNVSNWAIFFLMALISMFYTETTPEKQAASVTKQTVVSETQVEDLTGSTRQEVACVATAIYHESRGESEKGQLAVARVIQNRVFNDFAPTACGVVYQKSEGQCQFSWACSTRRLIDPDDCPSCWRSATQVIVDHGYQNLVKDALYFESSPKTSWCNLALVSRIGHHSFYRKSTKPKKKCK